MSEEQAAESEEAGDPEPVKAEKPTRKRAAAKVPKFAEGYPEDPELAELVRAFRDGDYRSVLEGAPKLAERTTDERVKRAAIDLRGRLDPDPLVLWMMGGAALLLVFMAGWFYGHRHLGRGRGSRSRSRSRSGTP